MHPPANQIEGAVVVLVAIGVCVAVAQLTRILAIRKHTEFTDIRLTLARYLALALEFELGADILGTAVSPSWDQIGKLGVVAVIRTGLNFFLSMEMKQEKTVEKSQASNALSATKPTPGLMSDER